MGVAERGSSFSRRSPSKPWWVLNLRRSFSAPVSQRCPEAIWLSELVHTENKEPSLSLALLGGSLFPRSWDERALQILWASNQGLYCQTSQTGVTRVHLWETPGVNTVSWPQGDLSTVMRGEWTALGGGPLSNQRAGEMDQEDSFFTWYTGEKYMLCLSRKAVWRFK